MATWAEQDLFRIEQYHIRWYKIENQKINVVTSAGDMRREAVDTWRDMIQTVIGSVGLEEPLNLIIDLTAKGQGFTPYSSTITRKLAQDVMNQRHAPTYIAIILKDSMLTVLISAFVQQIFLRRMGYTWRIVTKADDAIAWFKESPDW